MLIKKSQLAKLCGVKPPSISGLIEKGTIRVSDGRIDLDDVSNLAYLAKHNSAAATEYQTTGGIAVLGPPKEPRTTATRQAMTKKMATVHAEELPNLPDTQGDFDSFASLTVQNTVKRRGPVDVGDGDVVQTAGLTDAEISETLRKPLYDARKAKMESEIKAVALDTLHRSLGEREYFDGLIQCLWQAMQMNYIDVAPKQAALVCKRLGMVGHELEVIEVLESDVKKRQDNVAKAVDDVLKMRLSNLVKIEEVEE